MLMVCIFKMFKGWVQKDKSKDVEYKQKDL